MSMAGSLPCTATGRDDVIWMFILTFVVRFFTFDRIGEGSDRSLANTDILPDANFNALIGQGARQRCGFFHSWELLGRVYIEWRGIDGFAMADGIANDLEKAEFETIAAFCSYAEIREYEKTCVLVAILRVLQMVERGYD